MAGRGVRRALLGSGLLVVTLLGGAGGYGLGWLTTDQQAAAGLTAAPLALATTPTTPSTPTPPPPKLSMDNSEPLDADDIEYRTREFTVTSVVASHVTLRVPSRWEMVLQDPPKDMRFNEPERKRAVRVQGGFAVTRPPSASLASRIDQLKALSPATGITIKSEHVEPGSGDATLVYTYADRGYLKYAVTRWVANEQGLCILEIAVTGLPQDKQALTAVLDEAAESATRSDSDA